MIPTSLQYASLCCFAVISGCEIIGATTGHVSYDIHVVDAETRQAVPKAHIFVGHEAIDGVTDANGHYAFGTKADSGLQSWFIGDFIVGSESTVCNGRVLIHVDKSGYLPAEIEAGYCRTTRVSSDLQDEPVDPKVYRQIALQRIPTDRPATESSR